MAKRRTGQSKTARLQHAFASPLRAIARALSVVGAGQEWTVICNGGRGELVDAAGKLGARIVAERSPSLDEIFVARAGRRTAV